MECLRQAAESRCARQCAQGCSAEDGPRPTPARGDTFRCTRVGEGEERRAPTPPHFKSRQDTSRESPQALRRAGGHPEHLRGALAVLPWATAAAAPAHLWGPTASPSPMGAQECGEGGGDPLKPSGVLPAAHTVWSQSPHKAQEESSTKQSGFIVVIFNTGTVDMSVSPSTWPIHRMPGRN